MMSGSSVEVVNDADALNALTSSGSGDMSANPLHNALSTNSLNNAALNTRVSVPPPSNNNLHDVQHVLNMKIASLESQLPDNVRAEMRSSQMGTNLSPLPCSFAFTKVCASESVSE